jgi:hypothetical protein
MDTLKAQMCDFVALIFIGFLIFIKPSRQQNHDIEMFYATIRQPFAETVHLRI